MLFNSLDFLVFFLVVYAAFSALRSYHKVQNWLLLAASYVFYGWWEWRFLSLILISTIVDFSVAKGLDLSTSDRVRRRLLAVSLVVNLGLLGFFKYFGFFVDSARSSLASIGIDVGWSLEIVLPVGISFYTFQTMGYTIDVYRRRLEHCRRLDYFALYVAFFPQLVAGPIERAERLLSQIGNPRSQNAAATNAGVWLILWGLFKKVVIADNLAPIVEEVFGRDPERAGLDIVLGVVAFTIQIYCDFSGYSDIARGVAKMLGFDLMVNFALPYIAEDPSSFWERWHISLSSWLRDYLYIPLGGNRTGRTNRNLMITMLLGGLWHGAAWNFIVWGLFHGLLLIGYRAWRVRVGPAGPGLVRRLARIGVMFCFTMIGWVIFRADSFETVSWMVANVGLAPVSGLTLATVASSALVLAGVGALQLRSDNLLAPAAGAPLSLGLRYGGLILAIFVLGARTQTEFIYFQF